MIEKTPDAMAVREPVMTLDRLREPLSDDALKDDPLNEHFKRVDTSVSRYDRLRELLAGTSGPIDAAQCATFLRDRRLPGARFWERPSQHLNP